MKLLLAHTEAEAFQHTSEVPFGDTPIFILQYKRYAYMKLNLLWQAFK